MVTEKEKEQMDTDTYRFCNLLGRRLGGLTACSCVTDGLINQRMFALCLVLFLFGWGGGGESGFCPTLQQGKGKNEKGKEQKAKRKAERKTG